MLPIILVQQARAEAVLLDHRLDAEAAALHQRELGRHVERVGGEQQEREQQIEGSRTHACLATALALRDVSPVRRDNLAFIRQLLLQEVAHQRRLDVVCDQRPADRLAAG